jgi:hypothetical protein
MSKISPAWCLELLQLRLEVLVEVFRDFHIAYSNFCGSGIDKFLVYSTQRNSIEGKKFSYKQQATA